VRLEKESDLEMIGKEHVITLMNHKYDIDWLMAWILAERLQMLGVTLVDGLTTMCAVEIMCLPPFLSVNRIIILHRPYYVHRCGPLLPTE